MPKKRMKAPRRNVAEKTKRAFRPKVGEQAAKFVRNAERKAKR